MDINQDEPLGNRSLTSMVGCWTGPRGSGKSLAMTFDAICNMMKGIKVWSNYPIHITTDFGSPGVYHRYESLPLNMDEVYRMDADIAGGWVYLDELVLWVDNRRSQSTGNALINGLFNMMRHRRLSFGIAIQNFSWLDKRLQFQVDTEVECRDLSYKYRKLPRGSLIGLRFKDLSGISTGSEYHVSGHYIEKQLWGTPFWNCYDSWLEYDYFEARRKPVVPDNKSKDNEAVIADVVGFLKEASETEIESGELAKMLSDAGCTSDLKQCGGLLKKYGLQYKRGRTPRYLIKTT